MKDDKKVLATARGYVRSITMLPLNEMCYPSTARKAVELANELMAVLEENERLNVAEGS